MLAPLVATTGCAEGSFDASLDAGFKKLFTPRRTPQQYMIVAVSEADPDLRRDAVAHVADSKQFNREWAIKGFVAIALLESDQQARCIAIRALGRTGDPRAIDTALKILNYTREPPEEVRPPAGLCRWDATTVLANLSLAGQVPADRVEAVQATLIDRLRGDTDRHVRAAAARGLGACPAAEVVRQLIDSLRDADFAVAYACETSLVRLTGRTHGCDDVAWNAWYEQNEDNAFADAGRIPESRRPPYDNRFEKAAYEVKQFVRWIVPAKKE